MIPLNNMETIGSFKVVTAPSETYKIDFEKNKTVGKFEGIEAVKQAIYKILLTERYKYEIYSWNYGIFINDLLGKPKSYVKAVLPQRIQDALKPDDRINTVHDFDFKDIDKTTLAVSFTADTVYGQVSVSWEVSCNV